MEYIFQHSSGEFTGQIVGNDGKLLKVKLTSTAESSYRFPDGRYQVGETRFIKVDTPKKRKQ